MAADEIPFEMIDHLEARVGIEAMLLGVETTLRNLQGLLVCFPKDHPVYPSLEAIAMTLTRESTKIMDWCDANPGITFKEIRNAS